MQVGDLLATLCQAVGVDPATQNVSEEGRPNSHRRRAHGPRAVGMNRTGLTLLLLIGAALGCGRQTPPPKQTTTPPAAKAESTPLADTELAQVDVATEDAVPDADQNDSSEAPEPVEPVTPVGRIILFTPVGPLVLDLVVTIDGEPLTNARQRTVDEMVAKLMSEANGELTWESALDDPRFSLGEAPRTRQDRRILIASVDANRDRLVQPGEAAEYLARLANIGPALAFGVSQQTWSDRAASQLWRLADRDRDGTISQEEAAALESELLKLDADGNELVEAAELADDEMQRRRVPAMPYAQYDRQFQAGDPLRCHVSRRFAGLYD